MNIAKLRADVAKADRVAAFTHDDDIAKVFKDLAEDYVQDVLADATSPSWHRYHALQDVLTALDKIISDGAIAQAQLKHE